MSWIRFVGFFNPLQPLRKTWSTFHALTSPDIWKEMLDEIKGLISLDTVRCAHCGSRDCYQVISRFYRIPNTDGSTGLRRVFGIPSPGLTNEFPAGLLVMATFCSEPCQQWASEEIVQTYVDLLAEAWLIEHPDAQQVQASLQSDKLVKQRYFGDVLIRGYRKVKHIKVKEGDLFLATPKGSHIRCEGEADILCYDEAPGIKAAKMNFHFMKGKIAWKHKYTVHTLTLWGNDDTEVPEAFNVTHQVVYQANAA